MKPIWLLVFLLLAGCSHGISAQPNTDRPFEILREAYATRDADKAASAYSKGAELIYDYDSTIERYRSTEAIRASFEELFERVDPAINLDLNFRIKDSEHTDAELRQAGIYRLKFGNLETSYGTFETVRSAASPDRFVSDRSTSSSRQAFELLPGKVMLNADNDDLDPEFYDKHVGRYKMTDNCAIVITRSVVRLFARNTCTQEWRGLTRQSGLVWTAGDRVISSGKTTQYGFNLTDNGAIDSVTIRDLETSNVVMAKRRDLSTREPVTFKAADGTTLYGNLYRPLSAKSAPATVFVHGSGPQDRNGYASIIAASAEELAALGHIVLTFDKRGVGQSQGDWSKMGFAALGSDARAAIEWLRKQPGVDVNAIGLAGSSQAGWVIAKAIEQGAQSDHVHLLGAAGSALTVEEQNIYNTRIRMQCAGISQPKIELALKQQQAFFDYVRSRENPEKLDLLTAEGNIDPAIRDWLFPSSNDIDFDAGNWFTTLELDFDPLPVWKNYEGKAVFVFSEFDDSTPSNLAIKRIKNVALTSNGDLQLRYLRKTQHIGLKAGSICKSGLRDSVGFNPELFSTFRDISNKR